MSASMLRSWEAVVTAQDREVYAAAGYGQRGGLGNRPALLVIDVTYGFVGDRPEPILESIKRFPNSCGEPGWGAVHAIRQLLDAARSRNVPIIYTAGVEGKTAEEAGRWAQKHPRTLEPLNVATTGPASIVKEIAPQPGDYILSKTKPSVFFGTPLAARLIQYGVDTLLVTGCTTSGCVRASVVDAFSYNYRVGVVQEGVFDRGEIPHLVNLWDMHAKYADIITLREALTYLEQLRPLAVTERTA